MSSLLKRARPVESARGESRLLKLETTGHSEAALWDRLDAFQTVSSDMAGTQDPAELADLALRLAIDLTGATVAFIGLVDQAGNHQEVYSRGAGAEPSMTGDQIDALFAATSKPPNPARRAPLVPDHGLNDYVGTPLKAGGKVIGMMGVAGGSVYTVVQRRAVSLLGKQGPAPLQMSRPQHPRQGLGQGPLHTRTGPHRTQGERRRVAGAP